MDAWILCVVACGVKLKVHDLERDLCEDGATKWMKQTVLSISSAQKETKELRKTKNMLKQILDVQYLLFKSHCPTAFEWISNLQSVSLFALSCLPGVCHSSNTKTEMFTPQLTTTTCVRACVCVCVGYTYVHTRSTILLFIHPTRVLSVAPHSSWQMVMLWTITLLYGERERDRKRERETEAAATQITMYNKTV